MSESKLSSVLPNNSVIDVMPGKPISTIYANNDNLLKQLELVQYNNDVEMSFPSPSFGATNTFRFPRAYQFLKNITMILEIDYTSHADFVINEDYLAYHMIKELKWQLGGTEQLTIKGESFMHIAMSQCENQEKKNRLLDLAGPILLGANGAKSKRQYIAMLPLPWCSLQSKKMNHSQYPLPIHMLNEPVELQITFRSKAECFTIGGGDATIQKAYLNFEYAKIASPNQLKNTVYKYPFISNFSFEYNIANATNLVSVDLNSFRKGELRGISFSYVPKVLNDKYNYYSGRRVSDISLSFNGQLIWKTTKNELYELIYGKSFCTLGRRKIGYASEDTYTIPKAQIVVGGTQATNDVVVTLNNPGYLYQNVSGSDIVDEHTKANLQKLTAGDIIVSRGEVISKTDTDFGGKLSEKYYYYIPLSEIKDFSQNFTLGVDASKQSLQLNFTRPDTDAGGKLYVTYHYSACYQFEGDNAILIF